MKKNITWHVLLGISMLSSVASFAQAVTCTYAIKNLQTGMLLRMKDANSANGTPLVAYSPVNWKCVTWDFKHVDGNTYQLRNLFTGKTFQAKDGLPLEGKELEQQHLGTLQVNQQYDFILVEKSVCLIRANCTKLYLTPADKKGSQDSKIILAKKDGTLLQQWAIYEQKPAI